MWRYYIDKQDLNAAGDTAKNLNANNNSASFKFKQKIIVKQETMESKVLVPWQCEINLILTWFENCFIIVDPVDSKVPTFDRTDTESYIPVVNFINAR